MSRLFSTVLAVAAALAVSGCSASPTDTTETEMPAIHKLRSGLEAAIFADDAVKAASFYTADAVRMLEDEPQVVGHDAIVNSHKAAMADFKCELSLAPEETKVAGGWAFERGQYMLHLRPRAGGGMIMDHGKYMIIMQKQADGSWKVAREISNSNAPPAPRPAPAVSATPTK
jgi:ketosteroid isomerase-like protein